MLDRVDHRPHIFRIKVLDQIINFAIELPVSRVGGGVFDRADNIFSARGAAGSSWLGAEMDRVGEARSDERVEISLAAFRAGFTGVGIA